jgi:hypothetical protein
LPETCPGRTWCSRRHRPGDRRADAIGVLQRACLFEGHGQQSGAAELERRLAQAAEVTDPLAAIGALEAARVMPGRQLDDCPLYGESTYLEERRP